eukprot:6188076-Pleurochrysis_carterae.AAC.1
MQKWLVQAKPGDELEELPGTTSQARYVETIARTSTHARTHTHILLRQPGTRFLPSLHGPSARTQAAMLFADASGFTALTERLALKPDGAELMCQVRSSTRR